MCGSGKNVGFPFARGEEDVVFGCLVVVFLGELGAEDGVGKPGLVADAGCEGDVGVIEVGGAPGEGPRVEGYDEDSVTIVLGAAEELLK